MGSNPTPSICLFLFAYLSEEAEDGALKLRNGRRSEYGEESDGQAKLRIRELVLYAFGSHTTTHFKARPPEWSI